MVKEAQAIPSYSRKYKTSCSACHYAFPKLNGFGKAFRNNGDRHPAVQYLEMTKEDPVILGAPGYKRVWPDAIWPTGMAGSSPLSVHAIGRIHYDDIIEADKSIVPGVVVMIRANVKFSLEYLKPLDDPLKDDDRFTF